MKRQMMSKTYNSNNDTAVSRKVVEKSARDNLERYCGWFLVHCFSKNGKKFHGRMFASAKGKQQK